MKNKHILYFLLIYLLTGYSSSAQFQLAGPGVNRWFYMTQEYDLKTIQLATGAELQYAEQGNSNGVPVIFLHGFTDSWRSFEPVLPFLPASLHVFALTQRGHGHSSKPASGYHPRDFAADVAAFIREKRLDSVFVVGHSLGGLVAQQLALDYPGLVRGIVLAATDAAYRDNPGIPELEEEIMKLSDPVGYEFADAFQRGTFAGPVDEAYLKIFVKESLKVPARVWQLGIKGIMSVDYTGNPGQIGRPSLILWGEKDNICPRADQDKLVAGIKGAKLIIYERTGHALHWEEAERFANDVTQFINSKK